MKKALSYDDVLLIPQYSDIESRNEIIIGSDLDECVHLELPIIASPMDTITESDMAAAMSKNKALAIIHRYCTIHEQSMMVEEAIENVGTVGYIGAAVGVKGDFKERVDELINAGAEIICIDVAHGHHVLMEKALKTLKDKHGSSIHLMAGNVATAEGYIALDEWGADSVRCNIGGGSVCTTRIQTGHGIPGFQTILDCVAADKEAKIIADGGIRNSGDIVKALAAGANFVMCGSLLAGTNETPGVVHVESGVKYKTYRGMASKEAQGAWRGTPAYSEGVSTKVPYRGSVSYVLKELQEGIKSGFSYSGARTIEELWHKAEFLFQTNAGQKESNPHILLRI